MKNKFNSKFIQSLIFSKYEIKAKAVEINGETDDNFKITYKNQSFFFKIYPENTDKKFVDFQVRILEILKTNKTTANNILDHQNKLFDHFIDQNNEIRYYRMNNWVDGRLWSSVNPVKNNLRKELGIESAKLVKDLNKVKSIYKRKDFHWDLANFQWVESHYKKLELKEDTINTIKELLSDFNKNLKKYEKLRKCLIHNDLNDNNIIVSNSLVNPKIKGFIDFGDCIKTQLINELAITCCYGIINSLSPIQSSCEIIKGFNSIIKIKEEEVDFLYDLILIRISISIIKSSLNKKLQSDNKYLQISDKDMHLLFKKWSSLNKELVTCFFREACGFTPNINQIKFQKLINKRKSSVSVLFKNINSNKLKEIDLSVSSKWLTNELINDVDLFKQKINSQSDLTFCGGYLENRAVYNSSDYERLTDYGFENRTTHLGIDFWVKENTSIHAIGDGIIKNIVNDKTIKGYGGLIIIEHKLKNINYYSLYGHLSDQNKSELKIGDKIKKGEKIGEIGSTKENGGWCPHLHFQIMLSLLDFKNDFPGVCMEYEKKTWSSICPNPELILDINLSKKKPVDENKLKTARQKYLGNNLKMSYDLPVYMVRGFNQFLYSNNGKKYLDTVNNIAHVGHQNINVTNAAKNQMGILNTNTRYLHDEILSLSKNLLSKFSKKLSKVYYVNSGSEANELAIRMSNIYNQSDKYIVMEGGYHGNTNKTLEVSNYKYKSKGGKGKPKNIYEIPMPDEYRGKYRGKNASENYFKELEKIIQKTSNSNDKISAMIFEPIISCGGQIELPKEFLKKCRKILTEHNIIMICDEVQTGFGRMGEKYWGYELYDIIPDIITLGKPMGNGHPIGAVVCTQNISEKFDNGLEFFSSFGGNPVSCKIANEVIKEIDSRKLQLNADKTGLYLKTKLKQLAKKFPLIGDVRGKGLFIGMELVNEQLYPQADKAVYLVNRMKDLGILMSNDGLDKNVIKIKPPIIFSIEDSDKLVTILDKVFGEDFMLSN